MLCMGRGPSRGLVEAVSPRLLVWLGVLIVVLVIGYALSGPVGSLFWQTGPVNVTVSNAANQTHMFEVSVVEYPSNVTIRRSDGRVATGDINPGLSTHEPGPHYFTAIELHGSHGPRDRYVLEPGEEAHSSIEEFPSEFAVVVVIYQDENEIVSWVSAHCSGNLDLLEVIMFHYGSGSSLYC